MLPSEFKEFLNNFNWMTGSEAKCEYVYMCNYVISGLDTEKYRELEIAYRYSHRRHTGTGTIRYEDLLSNAAEETEKYIIHLEGRVLPVEVVGTLIHGDEETSPLLQSSPRSKKVYVADLSNNPHGLFVDSLTHGKVYKVDSHDILSNQFRVWCDCGGYRWFSCNCFKEVYLYDEDETLLTCRDIEFKESDYIDLRKHTPEQIRHIAGYYEFYDVEVLLDDGYILAVYDGVDFSGTGSCIHSDLLKEYTYDDIFYLEEV